MNLSRTYSRNWPWILTKYRLNLLVVTGHNVFRVTVQHHLYDSRRAPMHCAVQCHIVTTRKYDAPVSHIRERDGGVPCASWSQTGGVACLDAEYDTSVQDSVHTSVPIQTSSEMKQAMSQRGLRFFVVRVDLQDLHPLTIVKVSLPIRKRTFQELVNLRGSTSWVGV